MADVGSTLSGIFEGFVGGTFSLIFWTGLIFLIFFIVGISLWYFGYYRRKFDIVVKVTSKRSGDNKEFFDTAGIFFDRKENKRFLRLKQTKIALELPKFEIFRKTNWGDYCEVLRTSEREFRYLTPPKIDEKFIIKADKKLYPMATMGNKQIESDITWVLNRERDNKKIIDPESIILKLLAYAPQIFALVMLFLILWVTFDKVPEWLDALEKFTRALNAAGQPQIVGS